MNINLSYCQGDKFLVLIHNSGIEQSNDYYAFGKVISPLSFDRGYKVKRPKAATAASAERNEGGGGDDEGSTQGCDDCPGFWHNYKEGWKSLVWNFKRMFGINVNLRRKINGGFVIYGPGGQRYELDYSQAKVGKGIIGLVDLSDPSNPYSALTYRTSTNVLDAMTVQIKKDSSFFEVTVELTNSSDRILYCTVSTGYRIPL